MTQNAVEIEPRLIGTMLLHGRNELIKVVSFLRPEHFYDLKHQAVWQSILDVEKSNSEVDMVSVTMDLKEKNMLEYCGGAFAISKLTDKAHIHNSTEYMARIIMQKYMLRQLYALTENLRNRTMDPDADCFELAEEFGGILQKVNEQFDAHPMKSVEEHRHNILENLRMVLVTGKVPGVPIRLQRLQDWTNGWRPGHLIVIAARPGMGKTASAIEFAEYPASQGIPVAVFSLEMTAEELTGRIMSIYSDISAQRINNSIMEGMDEVQHIETMTEDLKKIPLYIDDTPYLTMYQLRIKAMRLKREKKVQMIVVDYLQLMEGEGDEGNREQELARISRGLKNLAKELGVPILALAQLNRDNVRRGGDQKPKPSDIRECGAIEQDADMIIFPHRPEHLGIDSYMLDGQELRADELIVYIIGKYRGGAMGDIPAKWIGRTMQIKDYED